LVAFVSIDGCSDFKVGWTEEQRGSPPKLHA
jgi:hypothetical protein